MCIHYAAKPGFEFLPSVVVSFFVGNNGHGNCHNVLPSDDDEFVVLEVLPLVRRLPWLVLGEDWHNADVVLCPSGLHLGQVSDHLLF